MKVATRMRKSKNVQNITAIGKIESFDETHEKWETFVKRVEQLFFGKQHRRGPPSANHIKLDRKQNVHIVEGSSFTR